MWQNDTLGGNIFWSSLKLFPYSIHPSFTKSWWSSLLFQTVHVAPSPPLPSQFGHYHLSLSIVTGLVASWHSPFLSVFHAKDRISLLRHDGIMSCSKSLRYCSFFSGQNLKSLTCAKAPVAALLPWPWVQCENPWAPQSPRLCVGI